MRRWIITYDVAEDQRRYELAKILAKRLVRIQESVFEGILHAGEMNDTLQEVRGMLNEETDKLRAYPISERTPHRRVCIGMPPRPNHHHDFWIL